MTTFDLVWAFGAAIGVTGCAVSAGINGRRLDDGPPTELWVAVALTLWPFVLPVALVCSPVVGGYCLGVSLRDYRIARQLAIADQARLETAVTGMEEGIERRRARQGAYR